MKRVDILLVEDDPNDLELALHILKKRNLGDSIHIARDGEEALDFLLCRGPFVGAECHQPPKLMLLDLKLPKVTGLEVLREVKANSRTRPIPVTIMTSSKERQDMVQCYQLGANSYIQKPVDFDQFQQIVNELTFYWLEINQSLPPDAYETSPAPPEPTPPKAAGQS